MAFHPGMLWHPIPDSLRWSLPTLAVDLATCNSQVFDVLAQYFIQFTQCAIDAADHVDALINGICPFGVDELGDFLAQCLVGSVETALPLIDHANQFDHDVT